MWLIVTVRAYGTDTNMDKESGVTAGNVLYLSEYWKVKMKDWAMENTNKCTLSFNALYFMLIHFETFRPF
jgi:hypothetical protein